jgi:hypothetical protein
MSITYFLSENTKQNNPVMFVKHSTGQFGENKKTPQAIHYPAATNFSMFWTES